MSRFANFENIDEAVAKLKEVYYVDDNDNRIYFKFINFEQLSLENFTKQFPDRDPTEIVETIIPKESKGKRFYTLTITACIQAEIDDYGLVGYASANSESDINPETFIFTFGKYQGNSVKSISECDLGYLRWIATSADNMPEGLKYVCKYWIAKVEGREHEQIVPTIPMPTL